MLSQPQRSQLLQIARQSIEAALDRLEIDLSRVVDAALHRPAGAFVTLSTLEGDLRGCIGTIHAVAPLVHAVASNAVNAAFRDPRFEPLRPDELARIHIEISVMSPIVAVSDVEEIVVGRDGLIISQHGRAGLLLPQVAVEYGWDRETFLQQTCRKAGLPADAWREQTCRIERFAAEVFGE